MHEKENEEKVVEDAITNRSVRLADSTHRKMKELTEKRGKSFDEVQKELLSIYERVTLQDDAEFGSMIGQVNELLQRVGDRFSNMVSHANDKIESQEERYQNLKNDTGYEIEELKSKVRAYQKMYSRYDEENSELVKKEEEARAAKSKAEEQLEKHQKETVERIAELKDAINTKDEKIADKNEKIDELEKEFEAMREELSSVEEIKAESEQKSAKIADLERDAVALQEKHVAELEKKDYDIQTLKEKHVTELEKKEYEKDKAMLELERKYQSDIAKIHEVHNKKIAELYERLQVKEKSTQKQSDAVKGQTNIDDYIE